MRRGFLRLYPGSSRCTWHACHVQREYPTQRGDTGSEWTRTIWVRWERAEGPVLQVLACVGHRVDGPARLGALFGGDERPDEDDPLALLPRDLRPVIRVGGVGQVLVLGELIQASLHQVTDPQASYGSLQEVLDRHLLGPINDVLNHGPGVEVFEVQNFLVTTCVGDLQELVLL